MTTKRKQNFYEDAFPEARRLYLEEHTIKEIAQALDVSEPWVSKRLTAAGCRRPLSEELGIAARKGHRVLAERSPKSKLLPEIKRLYLEEEMSCAGISQLLGVKATTIEGWLKREGCLRSQAEAFKLAFHRGRATLPKYIPLKGEESPSWKGGVTLQDGYIQVYNPEAARAHNKKGNYIFEHILVWEQYHGCRLPGGWVVHHLNGIKDDNRPSNLVAMPRDKHMHLAEPFKKRIRELEIENRQLRRALESSQMIFYINEN